MDLLVEAVAYLVERLPQEPLLMTLLETDRTRLTSQQMVMGESIARSRVLLAHRDRLGSLGLSWQGLRRFGRYLLRLIQSMVLVPAQPPRTATELRAVLRHWIGPVVTTPPPPAQTQNRTKSSDVVRFCVCSAG
ncbi:hypothetical protein [Mycobacterium timonense]|uniref:hypothetical protein n=1 Tax=Mycobacterium timonense TaxID=701043 RepID=UPI001FCC6A75|nr:hypothetical protein [Mycobacterium timonense]